MALPLLETVHPWSHVCRMEGIRKGWEQWFLLRSDAHHDNTCADHEAERAHLDEAVARGAGVLDGGDLFCAMQGKWDKRADQGQLRPELQGNNYLDRLVAYNGGFYAPYAKHFLLLCPGNHETAIERYHHTHLTERLAERLRAAGGNPAVGTYAGWVGFRFDISGGRHTIWLARHHGYGGGGPVTRGVISTNRTAVYLPDAHLVWLGHTHDEYVVPIARERINDQGNTYLDEQVHIRTPGYKEEYGPHAGWHVERGAPPKPRGACWLRFWYDGNSKKRVAMEVQRARA